jgi:hypothetical protein
MASLCLLNVALGRAGFARNAPGILVCEPFADSTGNVFATPQALDAVFGFGCLCSGVGCSGPALGDCALRRTQAAPEPLIRFRVFHLQRAQPIGGWSTAPFFPVRVDG